MLQNDETIKILMNLGLTCLQAKTYLVLTTLKEAEAKKISKISNIARQDIYRIMPELEKVGLVERIISTPTLYKAIPLKEGSFVLFQKRAKEHAALQEKIEALAEHEDKERNIDTIVDETTSQFIVTSEKKLFLKKMGDAISEAQSSINTIIEPDRWKTMLFYHGQHMRKAMGRGVKIRIITEGKQEKSNRNEEALKKNSLFELKYSSAYLPVTGTIFDSKEVDLHISNTVVPVLYTNNPQVVKLAETYFECLWEKAQTSLNILDKAIPVAQFMQF